jgi:hypothetical protein
MKSGLSLTLVVCLAGSALPVSAQERTEASGSFDLADPASPAAAGLLARAVTRESLRLAGAGEPSTSVTETIQQGGQRDGSRWSRVRKLAPGTEIILTAKGSLPGPGDAAHAVHAVHTVPGLQGQAYVVQVEESGLTILNLSGARLSTFEREMLRAAASDRPEFFLAARQGGAYQFRNNVRIGPAGVFVAGRKVTEVGEVVQSIARADVVQVAIRRTRTHGSVQEILQAAAGGFLLTAVAAGNGGTGPNYCTESPNGCPVAIGVGTIAGGALGYLFGRRETVIEHDIIYRDATLSF